MASERELNAWWRGLSVAEKRLVQTNWLLSCLTYWLRRRPAEFAALIGRKDG